MCFKHLTNSFNQNSPRRNKTSTDIRTKISSLSLFLLLFVLLLLKTDYIHQKSNLRKLKEVDVGLEGEGFGHGIGCLVVVVAAVLVVVVPAALLPGTRGLRPGGVEESRHEVQPECHPFVVQIVLHPGCDFQRQVLLLLQPELWPRSVSAVPDVAGCKNKGIQC